MSRSTIDRRAVLAGAAAIPATAIPALAIAGASPDAELLRLGDALDVAAAAFAHAQSKLDPIMDRVREEADKVAPLSADPDRRAVGEIDRHIQAQREAETKYPELPGIETSWSASGLALDSVAKQIFSIQPRTLAGLAIVAKAAGYFAPGLVSEEQIEHFGQTAEEQAGTVMLRAILGMTSEQVRA